MPLWLLRLLALFARGKWTLFFAPGFGSHLFGTRPLSSTELLNFLEMTPENVCIFFVCLGRQRIHVMRQSTVTPGRNSHISYVKVDLGSRFRGLWVRTVHNCAEDWGLHCAVARGCSRPSLCSDRCPCFLSVHSCFLADEIVAALVVDICGWFCWFCWWLRFSPCSLRCRQVRWQVHRLVLLLLVTVRVAQCPLRLAAGPRSSASWSVWTEVMARFFWDVSRLCGDVREEPSGVPGRRESDSQVTWHLDSVHALAFVDKCGRHTSCPHHHHHHHHLRSHLAQAIFTQVCSFSFVSHGL